MFICRIMMVVLIGLWLGGCSVVVFEDSTACPAEISCAVSATDQALSSSPPTPTPTPTELGDSMSIKSGSSSASAALEKSASSKAALIVLAETEFEIDGYLNYFDYDSAALRKPGLAGLIFVADYLKANPITHILVEGHCDERGTRDYNLALGEKRADAVRVQLTKMGVDRSRIKTRSFGKERPVALGTSAESWAKNRRTVIRLIPE
ncbi:OmpA family protein [Candidatus Puniceispirillum sp.]|nr:OmpA family protein [Candidatus Puniceispirillum sp.]